MRPALKLSQLAKPHGRQLLATGALMLGSAAAALSLPYLAGQLAEALTQGETLWSAAGVIALVVLLQQTLRVASQVLMWKNADRMSIGLQQRVFRHLQQLPLDWVTQRKPGDLIAVLSSDVQALSSFLSGVLPAMLPTAATLLGAILLMAMIEPMAALLAGLAIPLFYLITKLWTRRVRSMSRVSMDAHAEAIAIAEESLALQPVVRAFQREASEAQRFDEQLQRMLAARDQLRWVVTPVGGLIQSLAVLGMIALIGFAIGQNQNLHLPSLVTLVFYGFLIASPIATLASNYGNLQQTLGALARINEVWQLDVEIGGSQAVAPLRHGIEIEQLGFGYGPGKPVFKGMSLSIPAGQCVALVGPNGAGKTTLTRLLMGFYQPTAGRILFDGMDLQDCDLNNLRRQIALVPQSMMLLNASVRDNIAFGQDQVTDAQIKAAAQAAGAATFVAQLPAGYDTPLGPRGVRLSGGQQQRIALARALVRDASLLILDEATAMFDPEGERDFVQRARTALEGKTVICISHRAEVLSLADQVIQLPQGRVLPSHTSM